MVSKISQFSELSFSHSFIHSLFKVVFKKGEFCTYMQNDFKATEAEEGMGLQRNIMLKEL